MTRMCMEPRTIHAAVTAPPSKSAAHRALMAAALSGRATVRGVLPSEDMEATLRCLAALGIAFERRGETVSFPGARSSGHPVADCGESGSTLRFFLPLFAALGQDVTFVGRGRLPSRPLTVYEDCLPSHGVTLTRATEAGGIVTVRGRLRGGRFAVDGGVSSQFLTGLLMALPLCDEDSEIVLTSPLQSAGYVDITLSILKEAGVAVEPTAAGYFIKGGQMYRLTDHTVEGDWSQAAFWLASGAVGGAVEVRGLRRDSVQGDRRIEALLREMGARLLWNGEVLRCEKAPLKAIEADVSDVPDLVPVLAVTASYAVGTTRLYNAARLRLKESDRLQTTADLLCALGGRVTATEDVLYIDGTKLTGGAADGANDHRIVMSAAVAALAASGTVTVTDAASVQKSWPSFFEEYNAMGGAAYELTNR